MHMYMMCVVWIFGYIHTYIHTYTHIPTYINKCIHTHTHIITYIHTHTNTYIHIHKYIHTCIHWTQTLSRYASFSLTNSSKVPHPGLSGTWVPPSGLPLPLPTASSPSSSSVSSSSLSWFLISQVTGADLSSETSSMACVWCVGVCRQDFSPWTQACYVR